MSLKHTLLQLLRQRFDCCTVYLALLLSIPRMALALSAEAFILALLHFGTQCHISVDLPSSALFSIPLTPLASVNHRRNLRGYEGYRYPLTFWTEGYSTPHFSRQKGEEFAVNRSNLCRINCNKTIFGRSSAPDPAGRAHDTLPESDDEGDIFSSFSSPFASGPKGASFSF